MKKFRLHCDCFTNMSGNSLRGPTLQKEVQPLSLVPNWQFTKVWIQGKFEPALKHKRTTLANMWRSWQAVVFRGAI